MFVDPRVIIVLTESMHSLPRLPRFFVARRLHAGPLRFIDFFVINELRMSSESDVENHMELSAFRTFLERSKIIERYGGRRAGLVAGASFADDTSVRAC